MHRDMNLFVAIYRTYRINQKKDVFVYRLVTKGTIEETIYNRHVTKESIARRIVDDDEVQNQFTKDELNNLYNFQYDPYNPAQPIENNFEDPLVAEMVRDHPEIIVNLLSHDSFFDDQDDF